MLTPGQFSYRPPDRNALFRQPAGAVVLVVLHLPTPLVVPGPPESLAEAFGIRRLQDIDCLDVPTAVDGFTQFPGNQVVGANHVPFTPGVVDHVHPVAVVVESDRPHALPVRGVKTVSDAG